MIPSKRESVILSIIDRQGVVTVDEICTYCGCSKETARRDLRRMAREGIVVRTHGGAKRAGGGSAPPAPLDLDSLMRARLTLLERVDVLIATSSETAASQLLIEQAGRVGVPVVVEGRHAPGATAAIVIENYRAGVELGRWVARYAGRAWNGRAVVLHVGHGGTSTEARSQGFAEGLGEVRSTGTVYRIDGDGMREVAQQGAADVLALHPEVNVIFGVNDDSTLGALDAYRQAGLDESDLLAVSFGLEGDAVRDLLLKDGPLKAGVALFPELVGRACIDAALSAYTGHALPERISPPATILTADTLQDFYVYVEETDAWEIRLDRAEQIPDVSPQYLVLNKHRVMSAPARIGYVQNFSSHAYYQNLLLTMRNYARQKGAALEVVDASQDASREMDQQRRAIGVAAAGMVNRSDTIILDAGQTVLWLARALRGKGGITVITNSAAVVDELSDRPDITLISVGGLLHHGSRSFVGHQAEAALGELRADKAFIGSTGVSLAFGLSNSNVDEAAVKQAILRAAREVILLADHTKVGVESLVQVAPIESVQTLVTNPAIREQDLQALQDRGVQVVIAGDPHPSGFISG